MFEENGIDVLGQGANAVPMVDVYAESDAFAAEALPELGKELTHAVLRAEGVATRSDAGVEQLKAVGADVHLGDLRDLDSLCSGATRMDAVVHLAFSHDFSKFAQNATDEIEAIEAL
jgi:hypothetical protein